MAYQIWRGHPSTAAVSGKLKFVGGTWQPHDPKECSLFYGRKYKSIVLKVKMHVFTSFFLFCLFMVLCERVDSFTCGKVRVVKKITRIKQELQHDS